MDDFNFARWIESERMRLGWTQTDMANATGLTRAAISKYENEEIMPQLYTFLRILKAIGKEMIITDRRETNG